jgi:hypothetical protein
MKTIRNSPLFSSGIRRAESDTQIEDDFDDLVTLAARGNSRAVGAIAVALGPMILEEARVVLGEYADEDIEVLQDFLVFLLDARSPFRPAHGRAIPWMCRVVRAIAQTRLKRNELRAG